MVKAESVQGRLAFLYLFTPRESRMASWKSADHSLIHFTHRLLHRRAAFRISAALSSILPRQDSAWPKKMGVVFGGVIKDEGLHFWRVSQICLHELCPGVGGPEIGQWRAANLYEEDDIVDNV